MQSISERVNNAGSVLKQAQPSSAPSPTCCIFFSIYCTFATAIPTFTVSFPLRFLSDHRSVDPPRCSTSTSAAMDLHLYTWLLGVYKHFRIKFMYYCMPPLFFVITKLSTTASWTNWKLVDVSTLVPSYFCLYWKSINLDSPPSQILVGENIR